MREKERLRERERERGGGCLLSLSLAELLATTDMQAHNGKLEATAPRFGLSQELFKTADINIVIDRSR